MAVAWEEAMSQAESDDPPLPPERRFYEDVFVLLGEVPTDQIIRKVMAECPAALLPALCERMRHATGHFEPIVAGRAAALRTVIAALESRLGQN